MRSNQTELKEPETAGASGGWSGVTRGTMYGPAIRGTMRADPEMEAALRALRAPEIPRPPPATAPAPLPLPLPPPVTAPLPLPLPTSRLAIAGLALAIPASPIGLVLSAIALGNLLAGRWRCRGENLALAGVVASVLAMTAMIALLL